DTVFEHQRDRLKASTSFCKSCEVVHELGPIALRITDSWRVAVKLALSMRRIILVRCVLFPLTIAHHRGGTGNETSNNMRRRSAHSRLRRCTGGLACAQLR